MRFFDTNVLVYAATDQDARKGEIARELLAHAPLPRLGEQGLELRLVLFDLVYVPQAFIEDRHDAALLCEGWDGNEKALKLLNIYIRLVNSVCFYRTTPGSFVR